MSDIRNRLPEINGGEEKIMDIICSYCKIKYGEKEGEGASHGACSDCFKIEMNKIENHIILKLKDINEHINKGEYNGKEIANSYWP